MGLLQQILQSVSGGDWYGPGFEDMVKKYRMSVDAGQPTVAPAPDVAPVTPAEQPAVPAALLAAPAVPHRHGLLGTIANVFSPEPGSWWYSAMTNPHGIWGARGGQVDYANAQTDRAQADQLEQAKLDEIRARAKKAEKGSEVQVVGNNALVTGPDGKPQWMTPPQQPDKVLQLIDMWQNAPEGKLKMILERAILKNAAPSYVDQKGEEDQQTAERRAKASAKYRAPTATKGVIPSGWSVVK